MSDAEWARLAEAVRGEAGGRLTGWFAAEPGRAAAMRAEAPAAGLALDWSRALIGPRGREALMAFLARPVLAEARAAWLSGAPVNVTEGRAANHPLLRAADPTPDVAGAAARASALADRLRGGGTRAVLWLGIGGSDLGPRFVVDALGDRADGPEIRFAANVDGVAIDRALAGLDPASTQVIVCSKSFATAETMLNAQAARAWLEGALGPAAAAARIAAVTARPDRAAEAGIAEEAILPLWDWIGGRFSVWSAVGLPVRIALGNAAFEAFLAGGRALDAHVAEAPPGRDMAAILAGLDLVALNLQAMPALAVVPYSAALGLLPAFLQQLAMESLGKSVTADGTPAPLSAAPIIWGMPGTDAQHSFFQYLHQHPAPCPVEFVLPLSAGAAREAHQRMLIAHCLAQASALMLGRDTPDPHKAMPGNRPSTILTLDAVTPHGLGALIALYEHRVVAAAALSGINPFDQWGVECGKSLAGQIEPLLAGAEGEAPDPATAASIAQIRAGGG